MTDSASVNPEKFGTLLGYAPGAVSIYSSHYPTVDPSLFPNHPYLLNSQFELTEELQAKGYVVKPIAGRCGHNVSLFDKHENMLDETEGRFNKQNQIYQALMRLPEIDGYRVQMCSFSVGGDYAAACVRVDKSLIITTESDLLPLRVVKDEEL